MKLDQYILEYGGFSVSRGRCHVVLARELERVLVGDPRDNPGTSVTNAIEQVAFDLRRTLSIDLNNGGLYEYVPWDPRRRREWIARIEFRGDAWSMPVWSDADLEDPFVSAAFAAVRLVQPYTLRTLLRDLHVINALVRLRIEADPDLLDLIARLGTIEHISQRRYFYVDVPATTTQEALATARDALGRHVPPEQIQVTTPNAPLDQPGTLPV